jgi:hypothetical protein
MTQTTQTTLKAGDRVLARIFGSDYCPATVLSTEGWHFVPSMCCPVEFDRRPITSSGTLNSRRVTVLKADIKPCD